MRPHSYFSYAKLKENERNWSNILFNNHSGSDLHTRRQRLTNRQTEGQTDTGGCNILSAKWGKIQIKMKRKMAQNIVSFQSKQLYAEIQKVLHISNGTWVNDG